MYDGCDSSCWRRRGADAAELIATFAKAAEVQAAEDAEANAVKAEVRALEDQLVSFWSRFTFIKPPDMVGDGRSKEQAREIKKAEKALASVEKSVRREDARQ